MMELNTIWLWMLTTVTAEPAKEGAPIKVPSTGNGSTSTNGDGAPLTDIHDIKPILDLGNDWQWFIYTVGALAILLGVGALVWWFWKKRQTSTQNVPATAPIGPDTEAYDALDTLAAENGLEPKQFYFRLSAVLRRYIERRYQFPAAEMTTEELLPMVDKLSMDSSLASKLKVLCRETDPIKFAGVAVRKERLADDLSFSRHFVRQTTEAMRTDENGNAVQTPDG